MKTVVYKYNLQMIDNQIIEIPKFFQILKVGEQKGQPFLWVKVNPDNQIQKVEIKCYGTGHVINDEELEYLGSVSLLHGGLIFHYFLVSTEK